MNANRDPLFDCAGRVVVVTGGFGQLGRAYCEALAARGAKVAALDAPDVVEAGTPPAGATPFAADVRDREALEAALESIERQLGAPDALVNNAAIDSPPNAPAEENGPFETFPAASFDAVMDVNVKGVLLCCQVFGGRMAERGRGVIVNIGSIYGVVSPDQSIYEYRRQSGEAFYKPVAYSASKSALYNLTRYLATYWGAKGVRVNILTLAGVFANQDERFLDGYLKKMPVGRMAEPGDYVGPLLFLISDASRYMTGANLTVDGGWTAW